MTPSEATSTTLTRDESNANTVTPDNTLARKTTNKELANLVEDFKVIEDDDCGPSWNKIVKSLEIFVIQDQTIFEKGLIVNGVRTSVVHPSKINEVNEKWIDLRGDGVIFLKVTYDEVKNVKRPISDLNFYKISKFSGQSSSTQTST